MKKKVTELSLKTAIIISVLIMLSAIVAGLLTTKYLI